MSDTITVERDLTWRRGDHYQRSFRIKLGGVVQNIAGHTFRVAVNRNKAPSGTTDPASGQIFIMTDGVGTNVPVGTDGIFTFGPTPAMSDQADYLPGTYYYDVEWFDTVDRRTIMKGKWIVEQDVTKE